MKFSIGFSPTDIKQLKLFHCTKHLKHDGCVNTASWLRDFCHLVTGSDDRLIKIWKMDNDIHLRHTITTGHRSNIFCVEQYKSLYLGENHKVGFFERNYRIL